MRPRPEARYHLRMTHALLLTLAVAMTGAVASAAAQTGAADSSKLQTMTGVVKTVSGSSLVLERGENEIAFVINPSTRLIGKGLASDLVLRTPPRNAIADHLKAGDRVTVAYRVSGSAMNAVQVRVLQRTLR